MIEGDDNLEGFSLRKHGLSICRIEPIVPKIEEVSLLFKSLVLERLTDDISLNRALIRRFVSLPHVSRIFTSSWLLNALRHNFDIEQPVFSGPAVSHFTSNNPTGSSFGLPMHQDFPSMASSLRGSIVWIPLSDCSSNTHSLRFLPCLHDKGLLAGEQTSSGYVLSSDFQKSESEVVLNVKLGDIVLFTPFTPHATFVNPEFSGWKMSISQRFDDLSSEEWLAAGLPNAYSTAVDRSLYLTRLRSIEGR